MKRTHLSYLDGLRGLAALWVFVGHATHFSQLHIPIISDPAFAVDLFIIISGFLMYYHAALRQEQEPMSCFKNWRLFWIRRYYRIAPLYYVALVVAILLGPFIAHYWEALRIAAGKEVGSARFFDHSWENILAHITFIFGLRAQWDSNTPLPDWSIGLEMQFYAIFPLLFFCMIRFGKIISTIVAMLICMIVWILAPAYLQGFLYPSMIILKLNLFFSGMLIAACLFEKSSPARIKLFLAALLVGILPFHYSFGISSSVLRIGLILCLALPALSDYVPLLFVRKILEKTSSILGNKFFHFLGEMSYGVYLIHFLIMIPFAGHLLIHYGDVLSSPLRFLIILLIVTPVTYGLAWILSQIVEKPGIEMGKKITAALKTPNP